MIIVQKKRAAAFTPASLSGLLFWHDGGLSARSHSSGDIVSQWNDLSGNGRHWTQGTPANAPEDGTRTINGVPALNFDGVDDFLTMGTGHGISTIAHLFMVVIIDVHSANDVLWHAGATTDADDGFLLRHASSSNQLALFLSDGASVRRQLNSGAGVVFTPGTAHLIEARFSGTGVAGIAIDGVETTSASGTGCVSPDTLGIFANPSAGTAALDGACSLTLGYDNVKSGTDLTSLLRGYINTRFAL